MSTIGTVKGLLRDEMNASNTRTTTPRNAVRAHGMAARRVESRDTNQKYVQQVLTILGQLFPVTKPDASLGLLRRAEEYGALRRSGVRYLRRSSVRQLGCAVDRARAPRAESRDTNQKYVQQVLTILGQLFPVTKPDASLGLQRRAEEYGALRRSGVRHLRRSSVRQLGCAVDRARAPKFAMRVTVEGIPISREELAASDWLTKVNKLREARTTSGPAVPDFPGDKAGPNQASQIDNGLRAKTEAELTPRQRARLLAKKSVALNQPSLPSNAHKLIVRPRGGLIPSKITTYQLLEAICTAARFTRDAVRHEDLIQANLIQNTFAYCTPVVERA
ncbi:hypothetical protein V5799_020879 [Amblyomma americanum]|uniref:Uncharacterized protein n=1 Tax=Amblyomma americanum TaxID=6943 RepID=A0AAQ4ESU3_AMBAM